MDEIICKGRRGDPFKAPIVWPMLVFTLVSGCLVGAEVPREGFDPAFSRSNLETLLGAKIESVKQELGQPTHELYGGDGERYLVYQGSINTAGIFVTPAPVIRGDEATVCSLLEFGPDQRLKRYETRGGSELWIVAPIGISVLKDCRYAFWSSDEIWALKKITYAARVGDAQSKAQECLKAMRTDAHDCDAETLYDSARGISLLDGWLPTCLAAHMGHPLGKISMGIYFRWGAAPVSKDLARAYLWFSLAERDGVSSAISYREKVESEMTSKQIAEAERLVAEWEPNPAECEEIAAQAGN